MITALALTALTAFTPSAADEATARAAYDVGRCVVSAGRGHAAHLLSTLPLGGGEVGREGQAAIDRAGCGGRKLPDDAAMLLRGAIAQELYAIDFREFGTDPRNRGAWIDLALPTEMDDADGDATVQLYRWADCVVRNDTENTERLLRMPVGSRREAAVLAAMQPYMSACLSPDARLTVAPTELRSIFAQAAYQTLRRYWSGELRQAGLDVGRLYGAVTGDADLQTVSCRRFSVAGTRVRKVRFCMTEAEWRKAAQRNREWLHQTAYTGVQGG
ncbi:MAG: hypothetical protein ACK4K7_08590 [Allosphingosinicella sp.]|uniref:hypothetical protein n=1 Tax=Allosphingosinicella sp. TaxID=2823234 RepID=UPI003950DDFC